MKILFLLCSIFWSISLSGQNAFHIKILDANSNKGLAFANVFLEKNQKGDASDLRGVAVLELAQPFLENDRLHCSYIGFRDTLIEINLSQIKDTFIIKLQPEFVALKEVEVIAKPNTATGEELIRGAIKKIKSNYINTPSHLDIFYREQVYENEKCILLQEALANLHYSKYPQKNFTKKSWRQFWQDDFKNKFLSKNICKQIAYFGHAQFFKYYNSIEDQCEIETIRKSQQWTKEEIDILIYGGPLGITSADKVKYQTDFLDPKLIHKYQYDRAEATYVNDVACIAVRFKPKLSLKTLHQRWDKKMEHAIFSGTVYIALQDFAIVKFECQFAKSNRFDGYKLLSSWQVFPSINSVEVNYTQNDDLKWHLQSIKTRQLLKRNSSTKWIFDKDYDCIRELVVNQLKTENVASFDDAHPALLKDMKKASLKDFPIPYQAEIWEAFEKSGQYPTLKIEDLTSLQEEKLLEKQFSGK